MAKVSVSVDVEKSGADVMAALVKIVTVVKANHKAGGSGLVEASSDILAALQEMAPLLGTLSKLSSDALEDRSAMARAVVLGLIDLTNAIVA